MKKLLFALALLPLYTETMNNLNNQLIEAIDGNNVKQVNKLLEQGANPNTPYYSYRIPLHLATENNFITIVQLLLDKGADPNITDITGGTPLRAAAGLNLPAIGQLLLDKGANPNAIAKDGSTPLHSAASNGSNEMVHTLLQAGVNPLIKDDEGKTALDQVMNPPLWNSISMQVKKITIDLLKNYLELMQAAETAPTQDTLRKAIEGGYAALVQQLIMQLKPTQQQVVAYGKIAQDQYVQTQNNAYRKIGQMLRNYKTAIGATTAYARSFGINLPGDIAKTIAGYAL